MSNQKTLLDTEMIDVLKVMELTSKVSTLGSEVQRSNSETLSMKPIQSHGNILCNSLHANITNLTFHQSVFCSCLLNSFLISQDGIVLTLKKHLMQLSPKYLVEFISFIQKIQSILLR